MGETYQIWRDEYPEESLVYKRTSPRGVPPSEEFSAVVIHLRDGGGGYKLYCKGGPGFVLRRCTTRTSPSFDNTSYSKNDRENTSTEISNLKRRKPSVEVVCLAFKYFSSVDGKFIGLANTYKRLTD